MDKIGISIVTPVYNVEEYIEEFLESIFNQSYSNFELILVNDESTDDSEQIIKRYKEKYNNIKYIYQENSGQAEARNKAFKYIKGKYVIYLDPDDYIHKNMLLEMFECAEKNSSSIVICGYNIIYNNVENSIKLYNLKEGTKYDYKKILSMIIDFEIDGYLWNKLFLTKNLKRNGIYFEKGRVIEDLFPVYHQLLNADIITYINKPLYFYRQRHTSTLHKVNNVKKIEDHNYAYKSVCNLIKNVKYININDYSNFIANLHFFYIKEYKKTNKKINKNIYNNYCIENFNLICIIFKFKISIKSKMKLILYKFNILHKFI